MVLAMLVAARRIGPRESKGPSGLLPLSTVCGAGPSPLVFRSWPRSARGPSDQAASGTRPGGEQPASRGARRRAPWVAVVLVMAASCASAGPLGIRWLYRFALRGFHVGRRCGGAILRGVGRRRELPSGVVTLMFTDVVGSTGLWQRSAAATDRALVRHTALIEAAVKAHGGELLTARGDGDSTFSVFGRASDAVRAATRRGSVR